MTTRDTVFADALWAPSNRLLRDGALALAGSALIGLSAHLAIPMWPVPVTMQTFAVLLVGLAFGPRLAAATVVAEPDSASTLGADLILAGVLPLVLASLAQMLIVLAGGIDMGVGYAVGFANVITATSLVTHPPLGVLLLVALVGGYGLMAVITELTKVPAVVITLGATGDFERKTVSYGCQGDQDSLAVDYLNAAPNYLALIPLDGSTLVFNTVLSGSGAKYVAGKYVWWTKGSDASLYDLTQGDKAKPILTCSEVNDTP